jgi:anti-anti-sigma factor
MIAKFTPATPSAPLGIDASWPSPGTARLAVAGEIDLSNSDLLRVRLLNVLSTLHPRHLEVDLAEVTFLDCGGLAVLVVLGQSAARTGCRLRITNPQPVVRRVLDLTGLLDVLTAGFDQAPPVAPAAAVTASAGILIAA